MQTVRMVSNGRMLVNYKLRNVGRKRLWPNVMYCAHICLKVLMKSTVTRVKIGGIWAETSTWYLWPHAEYLLISYAHNPSSRTGFSL
jgi:hypothetical protein